MEIYLLILIIWLKLMFLNQKKAKKKNLQNQQLKTFLKHLNKLPLLLRLKQVHLPKPKKYSLLLQLHNLLKLQLRLLKIQKLTLQHKLYQKELLGQLTMIPVSNLLNKKDCPLLFIHSQILRLFPQPIHQYLVNVQQKSHQHVLCVHPNQVLKWLVVLELYKTVAVLHYLLDVLFVLSCKKLSMHKEFKMQSLNKVTKLT